MLIFHGTLIHSTESHPLVVLPHHVIGVRNAKIVFVEKAEKCDELAEKYNFSPGDVTHLGEGEFLMPGLVDTHIHAAQYGNSGLGLNCSLIQWLNTYTFPTEAKFADVQFAKEVYTKVVDKTLRWGTTTAQYFATIHLDSTLKLCDIIQSHGQRAFVGKVCMTHNSPPDLVEPIDECLHNTERFIQEVIKRKDPLLTPVMTPRFAPTSDFETLTKFGQIAAKYDIPIQSHLCENKAEIEWVRELFPQCENYTDIYHKTGLLNNKTVMAHCVHMKQEEVAMMKQAGAAVAHCPNSNMSLRSGMCDVRRLLKHGVTVGLGTDVAGGYHPSILDAMRCTIHVTNLLSIDRDEYSALSSQEVFRLATLGGSHALGLGDIVGNFESGKEFDALRVNLAVSDSPIDVFHGDTLENLWERFIFLGDDRNLTHVYVAGKLVHSRNMEPILNGHN